MPIVEPEVSIHATDKEGAERLLKAAILEAARYAGGSSR
jgi:fructose-bisphosphate aldolase class 1